MEILNYKRNKGGFNLKDVPSATFVKSYAEHLKRTGKVTQPEWSEVVKTGYAQELPPQEDDWFYIRAASLARRLYLQPKAGIRRLEQRYGRKERNGSAPSHKSSASGKIIRVILQQLEEAGLVSKAGSRGARSLTSEGIKDVDIIATEIGNRN